MHRWWAGESWGCSAGLTSPSGQPAGRTPCDNASNGVHTVHLSGHVDDGVDLLAEAEAGGLPLRAVLAGEAVAVEPGPESPLLRRECSDYFEIVISHYVFSVLAPALCFNQMTKLRNANLVLKTRASCSRCDPDRVY